VIAEMQKYKKMCTTIQKDAKSLEGYEMLRT